VKEKQKILIIDDDVDFNAAIKTILENNGYDVSAAFDPQEGDLKLRQESPDLIILDVMFGDEGKAKGFDFVQKIKHEKQYARLPILMLTAINKKEPLFHFSPDTDKEYLPVDSFIDKPINTDELLRKVADLLK
jgi:DNA-binding response OmpR family regulator